MCRREHCDNLQRVDGSTTLAIAVHQRCTNPHLMQRLDCSGTSWHVLQSDPRLHSHRAPRSLTAAPAGMTPHRCAQVSISTVAYVSVMDEQTYYMTHIIRRHSPQTTPVTRLAKELKMTAHRKGRAGNSRHHNSTRCTCLTYLKPRTYVRLVKHKECLR